MILEHVRLSACPQIIHILHQKLDLFQGLDGFDTPSDSYHSNHTLDKLESISANGGVVAPVHGEIVRFGTHVRASYDVSLDPPTETKFQDPTTSNEARSAHSAPAVHEYWDAIEGILVNDSCEIVVKRLW